jgi:hypothetical protein
MTTNNTTVEKIEIDHIRDAYKAIKQKIKPVWSVISCEFCVHIKENKKAKPDKRTNTTYSIMNNVFC